VQGWRGKIALYRTKKIFLLFAKNAKKSVDKRKGL
jgi:hypothetical protein